MMRFERANDLSLARIEIYSLVNLGERPLIVGSADA